MTGHHKAASCSMIPPTHSLRSFSTIPTNNNDSDVEPDHKQAQKSTKESLFPLPSFCLYSKSALLNEYASESDIIQFLYPPSPLLEERLPMFVGVLQSLFTVVNDLPFTIPKTTKDSDEEADDEYEEYDGYEEDTKEEDEFIIIGLASMKLIVWKDMCDHLLDNDQVYKNDLCLVIIVSSHITDTLLLKNIKLLKKSIMHDISPLDNHTNTHEIGSLLKPFVEDWFEF